MSDENKVVKTIEHPLEEVFDIETGTTEVEVYEREGELVNAREYDDKDKEIDSQYQEIYDSAMDGFDLLSDELHTVEGKFKARVGEVSVQHLNAALNAASHKARLKEHKDKLEAKKTSGPSHVTNNNTLIVDDRTALLTQLRRNMEGDKTE
jgi:hypothetical protein